MNITTDKRILHSGDIVEVNWDCDDIENPRLVMHSGHNESALAIPKTGTKRFRIKQKHGTHWIGIKGERNGKEVLKKHRIFVIGTTQNTDKFQYMDNTRWLRFKDNVSRWWNIYTPEKKRLYLILLLLLAYQGIATFWPEIGKIYFYAIICWLFWQVIKRD